MRQWIAIVLVSAIVGGLAARFTPRPEPIKLDISQGPFRPRPIPPKPIPPEPEPKNDDERKLFARIREWVDQRAESRAEAKVEASLNEVMVSIDAVNAGVDPDKMQGTFGNVFAMKLVDFVKRIAKAIFLTLIGGAILALAWTYWAWIAGGFAIASSVVFWVNGFASKFFKG